MSHTQQSLRSTLVSLTRLADNATCADCHLPTPSWASFNLGVFLCMNCAGCHRRLGTHITRVRSITLDCWDDQSVKLMQLTGNQRANAYFEYQLKDSQRIQPLVDEQRRYEFIRDKYERRRWYGEPDQQTFEQTAQNTLTSQSVAEYTPAAAAAIACVVTTTEAPVSRTARRLQRLQQRQASISSTQHSQPSLTSSQLPSETTSSSSTLTQSFPVAPTLDLLNIQFNNNNRHSIASKSIELMSVVSDDGQMNSNQALFVSDHDLSCNDMFSGLTFGLSNVQSHTDNPNQHAHFPTQASTQTLSTQHEHAQTQTFDFIHSHAISRASAADTDSHNNSIASQASPFSFLTDSTTPNSVSHNAIDIAHSHSTLSSSPNHHPFHNLTLSQPNTTAQQRRQQQQQQQQHSPILIHNQSIVENSSFIEPSTALFTDTNSTQLSDAQAAIQNALFAAVRPAPHANAVTHSHTDKAIQPYTDPFAHLDSPTSSIHHISITAHKPPQLCERDNCEFNNMANSLCARHYNNSNASNRTSQALPHFIN